MTNFKNIVAAIALTAIIGSSATVANAGLLVSDKTGAPAPAPCTGSVDTKEVKGSDWGILVSDLSGIVVAGLTGIVVAGKSGIVVAGKETPAECGIVVAGKDGIVVAG